MNVDIMEKPKENIDKDIKVSSSTDVLKLREVQEIRKAIREHLLFIGLDNRNNVRNITLLGIGTSCNIIIDTKEIIRVALYSASDKVILVHNHPSNNLEPSKDDLHLTSVTDEMLKVFNIQLQDHIIVTEREHISIDEIKKIGKEKNIKSIDNIEKGLLIEENYKLKQQISELQNKLQVKSELKVISAECVGGYNDTLVYNATVNVNGTNEIFTIERHSHDMQEPSETWEISSKNNFSEDERKQIIEVISKNPPSIFSDVPPRIYDSIDEIEI